MKILFLDIDGVINTVGAEVGYHDMGYDFPFRKPRTDHPCAKYFDPACIHYLHTIVEETKCKIVVSSTWRHGSSLEEMKGWFLDPLIAEAIIDKTKSLGSGTYPELVDSYGRIQRGEEIKEWLSRHEEVTKFAVLDDDSDMDAVRRNFFQTDGHDGLKRKVARDVILFLNREKRIDHYRLDIALTEFISEIDSCLSKVSIEDKNSTIEDITGALRRIIWKNKKEREKDEN